MLSCIVKKEDKYFVVGYEYPDKPVNCIIEKPYENSPSKYILVDKGIEIIWDYKNNLNIVVNELVIDLYETDNLMQVCDYMNYYNLMENARLSEIVRVKRSNIMNQYETKVNNYKKELEQLKTEVNSYTQFIQKKQELTNLIQQLEY